MPPRRVLAHKLFPRSNLTSGTDRAPEKVGGETSIALPCSGRAVRSVCNVGTRSGARLDGVTQLAGVGGSNRSRRRKALSVSEPGGPPWAHRFEFVAIQAFLFSAPNSENGRARHGGDGRKVAKPDEQLLPRPHGGGDRRRLGHRAGDRPRAEAVTLRLWMDVRTKQKPRGGIRERTRGRSQWKS